MTGCSTVNRIPLKLQLIKIGDNSSQFVAQTTETYQLHLNILKKDINKSIISCLAGEPEFNFSSREHFDPCEMKMRPIKVAWEVLSYPENTLIASGISNPIIKPKNGFSDVGTVNRKDEIFRHIGIFSAIKSKEYRVTAKIIDPTDLIMYLEPKVIVRTPGYSWE